MQDSYTYAFHNIESRMTVVVVFENGKQRDKETHVTSFLMDFCMHIRCNKVYESLKLSK